MTTVAGLDLSLTSTGLARITWGAGKAVADTCRFPTTGHKGDTWETRAERIGYICSQIATTALPCDLVVVEGPSYASVSTSAHDRSWLWGKVFDRIARDDIPVVVIPPTRLKLYATGRGNSDKREITKAVARMWPDVETRSGDEDDALVLASIGLHMLAGPVPFDLTQYRMESLAKLVRPENLEAA